MENIIINVENVQNRVVNRTFKVFKPVNTIQSRTVDRDSKHSEALPRTTCISRQAV